MRRAGRDTGFGRAAQSGHTADQFDHDAFETTHRLAQHLRRAVAGQAKRAARQIARKNRAGDIEKIAIKYSESGADWSAAVKDPVVKTEPVQATPAAPAKETKPGEVVVADPTKKEGSQPAPTGAKLTPDQQKQHLTEIDSILAAKWGATKVGRDVTTDETSAKLVQRSLVDARSDDPIDPTDLPWRRATEEA